MEKHFDLFFENLHKRFKECDITEISEDCIRYDFFLSLSTFIDSSDIILEYPYSENSASKIDCVIKHPDSSFEAMEFKFFRPIPSKRNNPQTQLLGQLFKDFYKLISFEKANIKKIVIVTHKKMTNYINNQFKLFENINENHYEINIKKNILDDQENTFQRNRMPYNNIELNIERIFCKKIIIGTDEEYIVAIFNIKNN
jgi:hypothetical protein